MRFYLSIICSLIIFISTTSCDRYFQYSVLEVKPLARDLNLTAINEIKQLPIHDKFSFLIIADTQIAYDELADFVKHANKIDDDSISFILHGGDFTDYGANFEYNYYYDIIKKIKFPVVGVIGNHDMLGNGREIFRKYFGPENFSFNYGQTKFIVFNNNSRELAFDGTLPNLEWIEGEIKNTNDTIRNIFYLSHVPPMSSDFDPSKVDAFYKLLTSHPKARYSIHGHTHSYEFVRPYGDDLDYLVAPTLLYRSYVKVSVDGEDVSQEIRYF